MPERLDQANASPPAGLHVPESGTGHTLGRPSPHAPWVEEVSVDECICPYVGATGPRPLRSARFRPSRSSRASLRRARPCAPRSDRVGTCPPDAIRADIVHLRRSVGGVHYREVDTARLAHQLSVRKNFPTSRSSMSSVDRTPFDLEAYETRTRLGPCFVCALLKGDPDYRNESVYENGDHGALVHGWRRARFRRLCTGPAAAVVDPRGPLRDRRALHVVGHRKDVTGGEETETAGQNLLLGSVADMSGPGASNERHGRDGVGLAAA